MQDTFDPAAPVQEAEAESLQGGVLFLTQSKEAGFLCGKPERVFRFLHHNDSHDTVCTQTH